MNQRVTPTMTSAMYAGKSTTKRAIDCFSVKPRSPWRRLRAVPMKCMLRREPVNTPPYPSEKIYNADPLRTMMRVGTHGPEAPSMACRLMRTGLQKAAGAHSARQRCEISTVDPGTKFAQR